MISTDTSRVFSSALAVWAVLGVDLASAQAIEEVVVTAQKREQSLQDVPSAITAFSSDDIEKLEITELQHLEEQVPNLRTDSSQGGVAFPRFTVRGISARGYGNSTISPVSFYYDEVVLNNPWLQAFPIFDVERIEVIRGPQGTLWGKDTTGGAVHIVSRRPTHEFNGFAEIGLGRYDDISLQGAIGGTVVDNTLAARASVLVESRDGWILNTFDGEKLGAMDTAAGRLQLLWTPSEDLDVNVNLHARHSNGHASPVHHIGLLPGGFDSQGYKEPEGNDVVGNNIANEQKVDQFGVSITADWRVADLSVTSITAYEQGDASTVFDDEGSPIETERALQEVPDVAQFSQEIRIASDPSKRFSWLSGLHYFAEEINDSVTSYVDFPPPGLFGDFCPRGCGQSTTYDADDQSFAVYGHAEYQFTEQVRLSGGLRWTNENKEMNLIGVFYEPVDLTTNRMFYPAFAGPETIFPDVSGNPDESWSEVTWDATIQYDIGENLGTYAKVSKGFLAGQFNHEAAFGAPVTIADPETIVAYEIGIKGDLAGDRMRLNASSFYYDYEDMQLSSQVESTAGGFAYIFHNAASAKVHGGEIEIESFPFDELFVSAGFGYTNGEFTSDVFFDTPGPSQDAYNANGFGFSGTPKYTANLLARYTFNLESGNSLYLQTGWRYTGSYFHAALTDQFILETIPELDFLKEGSYWIGSARVGYETSDGKFHIAGWINNIADVEYHNAMFFFTDRYGVWSQMEPRRYGVSLAVNF